MVRIVFFILFCSNLIYAQSWQHYLFAINGSILDNYAKADTGGYPISAQEAVYRTITITPNSTNSKILLFATSHFRKDALSAAVCTMRMRVVKGSTVSDPTVGYISVHRSLGLASHNFVYPINYLHVDNPATTSPVSYSVTLSHSGTTGQQTMHYVTLYAFELYEP